METAEKKVVKTKSWSELEGGKHYPLALASHQDVVKDQVVFWDTLRRFHSAMSTKLMIPVIGGKELNLHILYQEVTDRGGYEKVVAEKKWREVGIVFMFSPTTTSASFVLKKHYFNLLYHYEQVYFFRIKGPFSTPGPAVPSGSGTSSCGSEMAIVEYSAERKRESPECHIEGTNFSEATGIIEGKIECGYLVSMRMGPEIFRGVLYQPGQPDSLTTPLKSNTNVPYSDSSCATRRRRRKSRRHADPNHPKPNRSGYNFFFAEKHYKLKSLYPSREREFTKIIGESWSKLDTEEKMVYQKIGLKDKERYKRELNEYKERMKLKQTVEANGADS